MLFRSLALAVCLAAGLEGIRKKITPPKSIDRDVSQLTKEELRELQIENLPRNLKEAVEAFEEDTLMKEVLSEEVCQKYAMGKRKEWEEYNAQVSQWELQNYLLKI